MNTHLWKIPPQDWICRVIVYPCNVVSHDISYRISNLNWHFVLPILTDKSALGHRLGVMKIYRSSTIHQHLTEQGMIHEVWKTTKRVGMQKAHKKVRDTCKKRRCHRHATDVALSLYSCFESISAALTFSWSKYWSSRFQSEMNEHASASCSCQQGVNMN